MVVPFKLSVVKDSNKAERALAKAVVDQVLKKKESLIGLATGQTMIGVYKTLVEEEKKYCWAKSRNRKSRRLMYMLSFFILAALVFSAFN